MIVYADTSALAKLVIDEVGSPEMHRALEQAESLATVALAYVELRAAAAGAIRARRVAPGEEQQLVQAVEFLWQGLAQITVHLPLLRIAGDLAQRFALRAYDAVHLAALVDTGPPGSIVFACWDAHLRRAASTLGYETLPQH